MAKLSITAATKLIKELEAKNESLEKQLASTKNTSDMWYRTHNDVKEELNQLHQLLDAFPDAPARKTTGDYPSEVKAMTRLAAWLSSFATK